MCALCIQQYAISCSPVRLIEPVDVYRGVYKNIEYIWSRVC